MQTTLPVFKIQCNGKPLPQHIWLLDMEIHLEINRIPHASITLLDGSLAERRFEVSDGILFQPGNRVSIFMGYQGESVQQVFDGIVTRHAVSAGLDGLLRLRVNLSDRAIGMTRARHSAVYVNQSDAQVMRKLITTSKPRLKVGEVQSTPIKHPELVQFDVSDWDFMLSRADVLGLAIRVLNGEVSALPIGLSTPKRILDHGIDSTRALELELDGTQQWTSLTAKSWDRAKLQPTMALKAKPPRLRIGNTTNQELAEAVSESSASLIHSAPTTSKELQTWADARLQKSRLSLLRGTAVVNGDASLKPLDTVEIRGVGNRFNGDILVSGVTHTLDGDGWRSQLQLGLAADWFARTPELVEVPAAGLLPPVTGLQIATVASLAVDPLGELRVQVKLPQMEMAQALQWARPLSPDAGAGRGFVFRPEVGDEVVIGFLNEDPRQPLILGALFGSKNKPPKPVETPGKDNHLRAIVSRSGTRIVFDDKTPALHIETTSAGNAYGEYKNRISMDEKERTITIQDQHNNKIEMNANGIRLSSDSDIILAAKGAIKVEAKNDLSLQGKRKVSIRSTQLDVSASRKFSAKAAQVELAADATFSAHGAAQAKLGSDAVVEIKAALVKIN